MKKARRAFALRWWCKVFYELHGMKKDSRFSRITYEPEGEGTSIEWLEPVSGGEYGKLGE